MTRHSKVARLRGVIDSLNETLQSRANVIRELKAQTTDLKDRLEACHGTDYKVWVYESDKIAPDVCTCGGVACPMCDQHVDIGSTHCKNCLVGIEWHLTKKCRKNGRND